MTIFERYAALPRARKGTTAVVIVEESILEELIADAIYSKEPFRPDSTNQRPFTTISEGASDGPPTSLQIKHGQHGISPAALVEEIRREVPERLRRRGW